MGGVLPVGDHHQFELRAPPADDPSGSRWCLLRRPPGALPDWSGAFVRAVAAGGEVASLQSVREGVNLPNRRMQPLIAELETKGLLYRPERGRLAFTVPLFGDYLRRNRGAA